MALLSYQKTTKNKTSEANPFLIYNFNNNNFFKGLKYGAK